MVKMYKHQCWFCGKEFETADIELDYCSFEHFHADECEAFVTTEAYFDELEELSQIP